MRRRRMCIIYSRKTPVLLTATIQSRSLIGSQKVLVEQFISVAKELRAVRKYIVLRCYANDHLAYLHGLSNFF